VRAEDRSIGVIRTPDQRLRVFVSSTLAELAEERMAVSRAISALRLTPVLFELGAQSHAPKELYRAYLAQSDIFIGLYWERYGWIGPEMDISGLEDEFRLSVSMPRLIYIKTPASHREARLTAMIEELQTKGTVSFRLFRTPRELGRLVRTDLAVESPFAGSWTTTSRRCHTCFESFGSSGRCAISCRMDGRGSGSCGFERTLWTTGHEPSCR
jgi:hypothetical protein